MLPIRARLAPSESKERFFQRLSLDENNQNHQRLYRNMKVPILRHISIVYNWTDIKVKREAIEGRERMTAQPDCLAMQYRDDPEVEPPYNAAQLSKDAIAREISRIYKSAKAETKAVYDLGRFTDSVGNEENWVIWWMLWHTFRYRDNRNKSGSRGLSRGKSLRPLFYV